jgi:hypothetical protein
MEEVDKYQKLSPDKLEHDHNIHGCLAIFAVCRLSFFSIAFDACTVMSSNHYNFLNLYLMIWLCADCIHGSH